MTEVPVTTAAALVGTHHGFLGREGGVSKGIFASLNVGLGSSDDRAALAENRRRAVDAVAPGATLVTAHQVHSNIAVPVTAGLADDARPHADALVTATPGLALGILTADCVPILFADRAAGVIGAAHSGWKGTLTGIAGATVAAMEALGATRENIAAAVGPCIAQRSYEVDSGFRDRFLADSPEHDRFFIPGRPGHFQFDLEAMVARRLAAEGLRQIELLGADTYAQPARYFSYRRTTHAGESDYGRQLSVIALG